MSPLFSAHFNCEGKTAGKLEPFIQQQKAVAVAVVVIIIVLSTRTHFLYEASRYACVCIFGHIVFGLFVHYSLKSRI